MNTICAFSSDSRTLYKADIYRVLSLPMGHIVHFRYKTKYVDDYFIQNIAWLKEKRVAIFFTQGNLNAGTGKTLTNTSIRWATVSLAEISQDTGVFHVYLRLDKFCNVEIIPAPALSPTTLPQDKFFSELNCIEKNDANCWQDIVNKIKPAFPELMFFYLKGIYKGGKELDIKYNDKGKSCRYDLIHGERYVLKMALGNPDSNKTKIEISDSSEEITINCINPVEVSAQFDDSDIPILVKALQVRKQGSLLTFKPKNEDKNKYIRVPTGIGSNTLMRARTDGLGEYATNIELNLKLNNAHPIYFGFLSTLAGGAIYFATPVASTSTSPSSGILLLAGLSFFFSTGFLFYLFNKK